MKFTLSKSKLAGYLQSALQVAPTKPALPILSNVMVEALEKKIKISATDLDISVTATLECNVSKRGVAVIPARILHDIIKELPETDIVIEQSGSRVEISALNGLYKVPCVSVDDYPTLPAINLKKQVMIPAQELVDMIKKTTFACSMDETRPALNGVLWQIKDDKMSMVATDGHRLARVSCESTKLKGMNEDIIVPPKALNLLTKFVSDSHDDVGVIFDENTLTFNLNDIVLTTRLIEGPYPNYEQVIPQSNNRSIRINRDELTSAVKRVSILSNALTHQVKFSANNKKLILSSTNSDFGGEGRETLNCDFEGDNIELGYNATYVTDVLGRIESEDVIIELESPVSAGVVYGAETEKDRYLCLLMPLRLAE